jgi:hypothetical protein
MRVILSLLVILLFMNPLRKNPKTHALNLSADQTLVARILTIMRCVHVKQDSLAPHQTVDLNVLQTLSAPVISLVQTKIVVMIPVLIRAALMPSVVLLTIVR